MSKRALLIISDGFEDIEAVVPIDVLTRVGVEVTVASLKKGPVRGAYGTTLMPTAFLNDVSGMFDAVILPGGKVNAENLAASGRVVDFVHKHHQAGKIVAAICAAPSLVLAEAARILVNRRATGTPDMIEKLTACGAIVTNDRVTCDGNIISAAGPGSALAFALKLAEALAGRSAALALADRWSFSLD